MASSCFIQCEIKFYENQEPVKSIKNPVLVVATSAFCARSHQNLPIKLSFKKSPTPTMGCHRQWRHQIPLSNNAKPMTTMTIQMKTHCSRKKSGFSNNNQEMTWQRQHMSKLKCAKENDKKRDSAMTVAENLGAPMFPRQTCTTLQSCIVATFHSNTTFFTQQSTWQQQQM